MPFKRYLVWAILAVANAVPSNTDNACGSDCLAFEPQLDESSFVQRQLDVNFDLDAIHDSNSSVVSSLTGAAASFESSVSLANKSSGLMMDDLKKLAIYAKDAIDGAGDTPADKDGRAIGPLHESPGKTYALSEVLRKALEDLQNFAIDTNLSVDARRLFADKNGRATPHGTVASSESSTALAIESLPNLNVTSIAHIAAYIGGVLLILDRFILDAGEGNTNLMIEIGALKKTIDDLKKVNGATASSEFLDTSANESSVGPINDLVHAIKSLVKVPPVVRKLIISRIIAEIAMILKKAVIKMVIKKSLKKAVR